MRNILSKFFKKDSKLSFETLEDTIATFEYFDFLNRIYFVSGILFGLSMLVLTINITDEYFPTTPTLSVFSMIVVLFLIFSFTTYKLYKIYNLMEEGMKKW